MRKTLAAFTIGGSFIAGVSLDVSINFHNGNFFIGPDVSGGAQVGLGVTAMLGVLQLYKAPWDSSIDNSRNTAQHVDNFLGGPSGFGCIGGVGGVVGGCIAANGAGTGYELGIATPGAYAGPGYTWQLNGRACPPKPLPRPEQPPKPSASGVPACDQPLFCVKNQGKTKWKDGVPVE